MARPKKFVDPVVVGKLAAINCSIAEIAAFVEVNESTIKNRFSLDIEKGREKGKASLKRKMWEVGVEKGNVTMLIWLSKQILGYSDRIISEDSEFTYNDPSFLTFDDKKPKTD